MSTFKYSNCMKLLLSSLWSDFSRLTAPLIPCQRAKGALCKGAGICVCVCGVTSCLLNMISQQTYMVHELLVVKLLAGFVVIEQGQRSFVVTICQNMTSYVSKQANWTSVGLDECNTWAVGAQFIMSTTPLAVEVKGHLRSTEGKIWCPFVRKLTQ